MDPTGPLVALCIVLFCVLPAEHRVAGIADLEKRLFM